MIQHPLVWKGFYDNFGANAIDIPYGNSYFQGVFCLIVAKIRLLKDLKQFNIKDQHRIGGNGPNRLTTITQTGRYDQCTLATFSK